MTTTELPTRTDAKLCALSTCDRVFLREGANNVRWTSRKYCSYACFDASGTRSNPRATAQPRRPSLPLTPIADPQWRTQAACLDEDPELFYPVGTGDSAQAQTREAKRVCRRCPVRDACLADAFNRGDGWAVRGGTTAHERARQRQRVAS